MNRSQYICNIEPKNAQTLTVVSEEQETNVLPPVRTASLTCPEDAFQNKYVQYSCCALKSQKL